MNFRRQVWICFLAKINTATTEFKYRWQKLIPQQLNSSTRTYGGINVERLASQNITSLHE